MKVGTYDESHHYHYIYEITNLVNGKKYIGKRKCMCEIEDDNYWGSGVLIKKAIAKYGLEYFKKEILMVCETELEACEYEKKFIDDSGALTFNKGKYYNLMAGGHGGPMCLESRKKLSKSAKIAQNRPETREKRRKALRKFYDNADESVFEELSRRSKGENNPMYGKLGSEHHNSRKVLMINLDTGEIEKEYESIKDVYRELDVTIESSLISRVCSKKTGVAYEKIWLYPEDYEKMQQQGKYVDWYKNTVKRYKSKKTKNRELYSTKSIYQLDKDTLEILKEYSSINDAAKEGFYKKTILRTCNHGSNTSEGYSWIFKDEYHRLKNEELKELYSYKFPKHTNNENRPTKKVMCLNTGNIFNSIKEANDWLGTKDVKICDMINGLRKSAGKHPETGEPLKWEYVLK